MQTRLKFWVVASWAVVALCGLGALSRRARADVSLPAIFGDHMVLQAGRPIPVWGHAQPGEAVVVQWDDHQEHTVADKEGRWRVNMPAMQASFDPKTLLIRGNNEVPIQDVLVGEVWLASGQSNMEFPLNLASNGVGEVANATHAGLRLFRVLRGATVPETTVDVAGAWSTCTPETAGGFSAVGYFFGHRVMEAANIPVGVIDTSWGGTPIEAWTSEQGLKATSEGKILLQGLHTAALQSPKTAEQKSAAINQYKTALPQWEKENRYEDGANEGEGLGYAQPGIAETGWQKMRLPTHWEDAGLDADGSVWFRKDVALPPSFVGHPLRLSLGVLNDCDTTYVGGVKVGESCHDTPETAGKPRLFLIPAELAKPGRLLVAVRVFDERGHGGFSSGPESLFLEPAGGGERISLVGNWNYHPEKLLPSMVVKWNTQPKPPQGFPLQSAPHALWDAMVAPLVPYALRGAIWYQGEANAPRAVQYRTLFKGLIHDWRKRWGQGTFPFYFVQLANFIDRGDPLEWPELREAQAMALALPATGMAVTVDIGDAKNIHPTNKREVGERLARWALAKDYGRGDVVPSGPLFKSAKFDGQRVRVAFDFAQGLRPAPQTELQGFFIAGTDRKFVPAQAQIEGDAVVVSSIDIPKPAAVRYAWQAAPTGTLQNAEGLPAGPFRTDVWPEVTKNRH